MHVLNKWSKQYEKCNKCNSTNSPHKAKGLCTACYQKDHQYPKSNCSVCDTLSRVHKKVDEKAICRKCYKEPVHICSICNKKASAAYKLSDTEFVCDTCYIKHYRKKQLCFVCNQIEILAINTKDKKVCVKCYSNVNNFCFKCGRNIKSPYLIDGNHVCSRCNENIKQSKKYSNLDISKKLYICSICGKSDAVQRIFNDNSVICQSCYKLQSRICNSCSNPLLPIHSHLNALPYCRNCYYKLKFKDMFKDLKKNWSECFSNILEDYFNSKSSKVSYETIWEQLKVSAALLNDLNTEFLDNKFSFVTNSLKLIIKKHYSRKLLVNEFIAFLFTKGLLSDYDSGLILLDNLNVKINNLPTNFKKLIIVYKEYLLQKLSKYREKGWIKESSRFTYYTCYLYILSALRFITFVNTLLNLQQPTEINNHTLDAYIRLKPYDKGNLRHFIVYLNKNKLTFVHLMLPNSNYRHELHVSISETRQKELLETCMYNNEILLRDRVIIILMLLYGITPKEIRTLKKSNLIINKSKKKVKIYICNGWIKHEIPSILSPLVLSYLGNVSESFKFVFPGRILDTSISLSSVCRIVKGFNVTATELCNTAVNNAMLNGLYQPALLMKSFGISNITATRYFSLIKGSMEP